MQSTLLLQQISYFIFNQNKYWNSKNFVNAKGSLDVIIIILMQIYLYIFIYIFTYHLHHSKYFSIWKSRVSSPPYIH